MDNRIYLVLFVTLLLGTSGVSSPGDAAPVGGAVGRANSGTGPFSGDWPPGTQLVAFENLEGIILLEGTLRGSSGHDTTGLLALDTGAGYLAVDQGLIEPLGLSDATVASLTFARYPLARLEIGELQMDQVGPVLTIDATIIRRAIGKDVLALLGQKVLRGHAVAIDYEDSLLALVPLSSEMDADTASASLRTARKPLPGGRSRMIGPSREALIEVLGPDAVAVPFEIAGDGKILVRVRLSAPRPPLYSDWFTFILDTGATKCVLFEQAMASENLTRGWRTVRGLGAPTLLGLASARVVRAPSMELDCPSRSIKTDGVDMAVIRGELGEVLTRVVGEPVYGLLGYSFLKRYRVIIDYPHGVLWLDPRTSGWDDRPYEYCHVGVQLEEVDGAIRVMAVAEASPAARAGITPGDEVTSIDNVSTTHVEITELTRRLEGKPGTAVSLTTRRGRSERRYRLRRQRLL